MCSARLICRLYHENAIFRFIAAILFYIIQNLISTAIGKVLKGKERKNFDHKNICVFTLLRFLDQRFQCQEFWEFLDHKLMFIPRASYKSPGIKEDEIVNKYRS
jgi:hypothetical protein